jgi:hypothetical protein
MRRLLAFLLLLTASAAASTTTFTATLKRADGTVPKVFDRLSILNCGTYVPFVNSDHVIANPDGTFDLFPNSTTGVISAVVDDQATIKCGTSTGVAYYHIDVYQGDQTTSTARRKIYGCDYDITGASFNQNTATCKAAGTVTAPFLAIQNVDSAGVLLANRTTINFFNGLEAADNSGSSRTDVKPTYGTAANTVMQGNDSRVTGALQASTLTTLGDILYEGAGPAPTRLAGNTTSFVNLLCQTGTGTISAAPAWCSVSGTGQPCMSINCVLTTPTLGVASATSVNVTDQTGILVAGVQTIFAVSGDFTTAANTNLQNITGLSWTLPANVALKVPFSCHLAYSQATAAAAVSFGIQDVTVAPTNLFATGVIYTSATAATEGNLPTLTTTTATAIMTGTPSAITTIWIADIDGYIEQPSNASSSAVNLMVKTATSGDAVTVKRGSYCRVF